MDLSWTRRGFLATLAAVPEKKPSTAPSELRRLRDPATEFEILRLTDPSKASAVLPAPPNRIVTKGGGLIYCSDRGGSMQAWRMEVKTGISQQLTHAEALVPSAVTLLADEKTLVYMDGGHLTVQEKRPRTAYTVENGWEFAGNLSVSDDGNTAALSESRGGRYRLRVVSLRRGGTAATLFEAGEPLRYCRLRPKRPGVLYNHSGVLTLVNPDGRSSKRLATAQGGRAGFALWSADGRSLFYLFTPDGRNTVQLRELVVDSAEDALLANTTQFVSFDRNAGGTVFVGASGSKAAPYVLLLVRSGKREMTLAEHKASTSDKAVVAFSSNSQRLFYGTDREGKPAIYSIALEKFVEDTDSNEDPFEEKAQKGIRKR